MLIKDSRFGNWDYYEIGTDSKELPTRIYFRRKDIEELLQFYVVELHAMNYIHAEDWDINHSDIEVVIHGYYTRKGLHIKLEVDYTSSSKTLKNIFDKLHEMNPYYDNCST